MPNFIGTPNNDEFIGSAGADQATGNGGNDILIGDAGSDNLSGGDGDDQLFSHIGTPYEGYSRDTLADVDTLSGGAGDDYLHIGYGDSVDGGANNYLGDKLFISFRGASTGITADFRLLATQASITIGGATITGIEEVGHLEGSNFDDFLATWSNGSGYTIGQSVYGRGGNDHIISGYYSGWAGTGIYGGDGNDLIDNSGAQYSPNTYGEAGDDHIIGGGGYERLDGGEGNDIVEGNYGYDSLFGGAGNDNMDGGSFGDSLFGEAGNDTLYGAGDADVIEGGDGDDLIYGDYSLISSAGALSPSSNDDTLDGGAGEDTIHGDVGNDTIRGGADDDWLSGGLGNDIIGGGDGNDFLSSGAGIDNLDGGEGDNELYFGADFGASDFASAGAGLFDKLFLQGDYSAGLTLSSANISGIDEVHFLSAPHSPGFSYKVTISNSAVQPDQRLWVDGQSLWSNETLWADGSAVTTGRLYLFGGSGDDTLIGGAQDDILAGSEGNDWVKGGQGNDVYFVDDATDTIVENAGEGTDQVRTFLANYSLAGTYLENLTGSRTVDQILTGNQFANVIDGGLGADTMRGGIGNDTYIVDNAGDLVEENANSGVDEVRTSRASYTLTANVENLTGLGTVNQSLTGNALANLIDGGAGGDTMRGLGGNDTYFVDSGYDVVIEAAGGGTDTVNSSISHGLAAEVENLTLTGDAAINGTGNALANILTGSGAANRLDGGLGADTMKGGLGDDVYVVDQAGDIVSELAGQGIDTVQSAISYTLAAALENLALTGSADINATGNIYANILTGNAGANTLNGGAGADVMNGALGNDTYIVDNSADQVFETSASGGFDVVQTSAGFTIGSNIEQLILTGASAINGTGNALANMLTGNSAANVLDGGAGADTMEGFAGNDTYVIDNVGDMVIEAAGGGTDTIRTTFNFTLAADLENLTLIGTGNVNGTGNNAVNVLVGNSGANQLDGGAGADTMQGGLGNDSYVVDNGLDKVIEAGGGGTDTVNASITHQIAVEVENLILTGAAAINGFGNSGANTLTGNGAANRLDGGLGADIMKGGLGDDIYVVDNIADAVSELAGQGADKVESAVSYTLAAAVENLSLTGAANIDATGNLFGNVLIGNSGANRLDGSGGADTMNGGLGNDTYVVDNAGDIVIESSATGGADTVESAISFILGPTLENLTLTGAAAVNGTGNGLANTIVGNGAANILNGAAGNDALQGAAGDDVLIGGVGVDTMDGGTGGDRFTFLDAPVAADADHILSFAVGSDRIVLDDAAFRTLPVGALAAGAFVAGTAAADADDRILYDAATGNLYFDSDGTDANAAILFATLDNAPATLSAGDFLVI